MSEYAKLDTLFKAVDHDALRRASREAVKLSVADLVKKGSLTGSLSGVLFTVDSWYRNLLEQLGHVRASRTAEWPDWRSFAYRIPEHDLRPLEALQQLIASGLVLPVPAFGSSTPRLVLTTHGLQELFGPES